MLVHIKDIVSKAHRHGYAIGAFNTFNLEITLGIVRAAIAQQSPVIIQVSEASIKYAGLKPITHLVETIAKNEARDIPVALHLDHGKSFLSITECIHAGFSSVHIDASELPFDENVALTKKSAAYAHRFGVWVQGELGALLGKEGLTKIDVPDDADRYMTDPSKVKEFITKTKINTLAVSVGTMHGLYRGQEKIDQARLAAISKIAKIPLVLHGGSGVEHAQVKRAIHNGIRIVNIDTELRMAFTQQLRSTLKEAPKTAYDPRKILAPSIEAVATRVAEKIAIFGSAKKIR